MKRLFIVISNKTNKALLTPNSKDPQHFCNKMVAKASRDMLEGSWRVAKGPDHMGNHGHSLPRMRRQPKDNWKQLLSPLPNKR